MRKNHYRRRRNPLGASGIVSIITLAAVGIGLEYLFRKLKALAVTVTPKSAPEKTVDSLYGPGQGWKDKPVYNTPGKPGYIPGLPPSYAPESKPTYYDMGQKMPLVRPEAPPDEPILTGLGRWL